MAGSRVIGDYLANCLRSCPDRLSRSWPTGSTRPTAATSTMA